MSSLRVAVGRGPGLVTAVLLLLLGVACAPEPPAPPPAIILLSLDTLRADHLPAWGYARPTTRALDAFVAQAVSFAQARCQSTGTLTSHLSLITSLYPPQFRVTRDDGTNGNQATTTLTVPGTVLTLASSGRLTVLETALSVCFWKAACTCTCQRGSIS